MAMPLRKTLQRAVGIRAVAKALAMMVARVWHCVGLEEAHAVVWGCELDHRRSFQ